MSELGLKYGFHYPERFVIVLSTFVLFIEDNVFTRKLISGWQEIILIGFFIILLIQSTLIFF